MTTATVPPATGQLSADQPRELAARDWELWGTEARLVVTRPELLDLACSVVNGYLADVDAAASRFRSDSELLALRPGRQRVSPLLADLLEEALWAACLTEGDVDPTVGELMRIWGYDRDYTDIEGSLERGEPVRARRTPGWAAVRLTGRDLVLPHGVHLDLGATGKAVAADRCADLVAALGTGVLVSLGGDLATAGPAPDDGWQVLVQDLPAEPASRVSLPAGAALATSSTLRRTWQRDGVDLHHVMDPRLGRPAERVWRTVTVAAPTCAHANALTTASIVRGEAALTWLDRLGVPARLVAADGTVHTLAWPTDHPQAKPAEPAR